MTSSVRFAEKGKPEKSPRPGLLKSDNKHAVFLKILSQTTYNRDRQKWGARGVVMALLDFAEIELDKV